MLEKPRTVDKVGLQEFLMNDAERLRRYIASKIPHDLRMVATPDDILQEVWIAAFRKIAHFRADDLNALSRWLTTLANQRLVDTFKAARRLKRRGPSPDVRIAGNRESSLVDLLDRIAPSKRTPSSEASSKETVQAVRLALADLPDDRRRAIYLRHIEGRSVVEISRKMHKTVPAVHSLLFRARKQLCECLGRASRYFSDVPSSEGPAR